MCVTRWIMWCYVATPKPCIVGNTAWQLTSRNQHLSELTVRHCTERCSDCVSLVANFLYNCTRTHYFLFKQSRSARSSGLFAIVLITRRYFPTMEMLGRYSVDDEKVVPHLCYRVFEYFLHRHVRLLSAPKTRSSVSQSVCDGTCFDRAVWHPVSDDTGWT